ncbi:hypothetical protein VP1G_10982 [Cytospora mali]|uniref:PD-(D/E)XK nuclease-like domain-containing protein n=1 Tax=Cytospora mali TaxID=578113 RepID=A0A194UZH2_CYTMA|nr:hypothetical protein VP1G_10982 [Valsa mali var. pyri (nom. inval.)]
MNATPLRSAQHRAILRRKALLGQLRKLKLNKRIFASALLIQVVGHERRLFIARKTADVTGRGETIESITAYGPIPIGSTIGLVELYQLVAALQVIKAWSETTFRMSLEQWLLCDELTGAGIV